MMVLLLLLILASSASWTDAKCDFPTIFNFGDSNSDTGGYAAAFPPGPPPPFGMTYFKRRAGRGSDGRLVIDFLAQGLGLPFLSPYLQSVGSDFAHGANFATGASTVLPPTTTLPSPFSLAVQLNHFKAFRTRVLEMKPQANLPPKDSFSKALYTLDIGQNDFASNVSDFESIKTKLSRVVSQIAETIKEIHELGGSTFMVFSLSPVGCYPGFLAQMPHNISDVDAYGCLSSLNAAVVDYNNLLKDILKQTRNELPDASITYVDTHSVKLELFQHPKDHGFIYGTKACCGNGGGDYNFNPQVFCGYTRVIDDVSITATACEDPQHYVSWDGTASACEDPQNYVSWDGIHFSEAADKIVALSVLNGSLFDPPFPLPKYCDLQSIE